MTEFEKLIREALGKGDNASDMAKELARISVEYKKEQEQKDKEKAVKRERNEYVNKLWDTVAEDSHAGATYDTVGAMGAALLAEHCLNLTASDLKKVRETIVRLLDVLEKTSNMGKPNFNFSIGPVSDETVQKIKEDLNSEFKNLRNFLRTL